MFRFFIDKYCDENMEHGLSYYASGLIETDYTKEGKGNPSGKDFSVIFIDPWGEVKGEWRGVDEILIIDANVDDFVKLQENIEEQRLRLELI
jgi:hypothetical protein